jgi:uncharacterized protein (DUF58 family)
LGRFIHRTFVLLWPTQRLVATREGLIYVVVWGIVLMLGSNQQVNLILLVAGLAAGPFVASFFVSATMLHKLRITRRAAPYVFSGDSIYVDYTLENDRQWTSALALFVEDEATPTDRTVSGAAGLTPQVFFARVPGGERARLRWQGISPKRGVYRFRTMELVTRFPFGLMERRVAVSEFKEFFVYPAVGQLSRRWHLVQRQAAETRRGQRHDRTSQQQEYHGLRDYRAGDSPRWIHWRTSARLGQPMVKEFEQQNEQDLAILLDPWLPRSKVTPESREALEKAIQFAATVCLDTCRRSGRRLLLGWTGPTPGIRQGPASVKLLHELLEQLAMMRSSTEGSLASLFDAMPPSMLREASLVVVSTRPINLLEEAERSQRLSAGAARGMVGRIMLLDAARGDLAELVQYAESSTSTTLVRRDATSISEEREAISMSASEGRSTRQGAASSSSIGVRAVGRNGSESRP